MDQDNKARPLERRVFREEIREQLIEDILSGRLAPGARIVETRIAQQFGVSQGPVREALARPRAVRLRRQLAVPRHAGPQDLDRRPARDLPDPRRARRCRRPRGRGPYRRATLDQLEELIGTMREAAARDDHRAQARRRPRVPPCDRQGVGQPHARAHLADDAAVDHDLRDALHHPSLAARDRRAPRRACSTRCARAIRDRAEAAIRRHIEEPGEWIRCCAPAGAAATTPEADERRRPASAAAARAQRRP